MRAWLGNLAKGAGGGSASASSSSRDQSQDPGGRPRDAPPQDQEGGGGGRLTRGGGDRPGIVTPSSQPSGRQESVFNLMGSGGRGSHAASAALDAEMERRVAIAARNLGDGVSRIVLAARMGGRISPRFPLTMLEIKMMPSEVLSS